MAPLLGLCLDGIRDLIACWNHDVACGVVGIEGKEIGGFIVDFYPDEIVEGGETGVLGECDL